MSLFARCGKCHKWLNSVNMTRLCCPSCVYSVYRCDGCQKTIGLSLSGHFWYFHRNGKAGQHNSAHVAELQSFLSGTRIRKQKRG